MNYTYIILDDDMAFVSLLKKQLSHFPNLEFLEAYYTTVQAAKGITKFKPDILFLDMEIDALNGLDVLSVLEYQPKTIVISSTTAPMEEALALDVYDYIKKPVPSLERLGQAIRKVTG